MEAAAIVAEMETSFINLRNNGRAFVLMEAELKAQIKELTIQLENYRNIHTQESSKHARLKEEHAKEMVKYSQLKDDYKVLEAKYTETEDSRKKLSKDCDKLSTLLKDQLWESFYNTEKKTQPVNNGAAAEVLPPLVINNKFFEDIQEKIMKATYGAKNRPFKKETAIKYVTDFKNMIEATTNCARMPTDEEIITYMNSKYTHVHTRATIYTACWRCLQNIDKRYTYNTFTDKLVAAKDEAHTMDRGIQEEKLKKEEKRICEKKKEGKSNSSKDEVVEAKVEDVFQEPDSEDESRTRSEEESRTDSSSEGSCDVDLVFEEEATPIRNGSEQSEKKKPNRKRLISKADIVGLFAQFASWAAEEIAALRPVDFYSTLVFENEDALNEYNKIHPKAPAMNHLILASNWWKINEGKSRRSEREFQVPVALIQAIRRFREKYRNVPGGLCPYLFPNTENCRFGRKLWELFKGLFGVNATQLRHDLSAKQKREDAPISEVLRSAHNSNHSLRTHMLQYGVGSPSSSSKP
jgi:hypothetical protein